MTPCDESELEKFRSITLPFPPPSRKVDSAPSSDRNVIFFSPINRFSKYVPDVTKIESLPLLTFIAC